MKALIPITGVLGMGGIVVGFCFKILHLPGADELILLDWMFTDFVFAVDSA
jgi:hypothetical protein